MLTIIRETQTDESDCEGESDVGVEPGHLSATNQIQLLEEQVASVQAELHNATEELKISKQEASATTQTINDLKAQA